ncbi:serine/threonine-protein kinase TBK1-like [Branchiostoma floridae x Branchiostoma japonicum]
MSFLRPVDVQMREFEMVLKLKHRNIVKLLDIEEEPSTKQEVIVMELCTGGSLYTILDEPENAYGLQEEEFKLVMKDVGEDGLSIYKLADFGAARELDDEEQFMSLYGTEEYLHPDMYERAVLKRPMGKSFKATVDLWSIGVTFYHVATGSLPFRPYGGARRNKEVMGFKDLLTPLLAGILECDSMKMWTFEMFFEEVTKILNMNIIHMFNISTAAPLRIYVNPTDTFANVQELVAVQTDIPAARQEMIFDSYHFAVSHTDPASTYPKTSPDNPIIVLDNVHTDFSRAEYRELPKLPGFETAISLDNDAASAKRVVPALLAIVSYEPAVFSVSPLSIAEHLFAGGAAVVANHCLARS